MHDFVNINGATACVRCSSCHMMMLLVLTRSLPNCCLKAHATPSWASFCHKSLPVLTCCHDLQKKKPESCCPSIGVKRPWTFWSFWPKHEKQPSCKTSIPCFPFWPRQTSLPSEIYCSNRPPRARWKIASTIHQNPGLALIWNFGWIDWFQHDFAIKIFGSHEVEIIHRNHAILVSWIVPTELR